jgi:hypothetical protein
LDGINVLERNDLKIDKKVLKVVKYGGVVKKLERIEIECKRNE